MANQQTFARMQLACYATTRITNKLMIDLYFNPQTVTKGIMCTLGETGPNVLYQSSREHCNNKVCHAKKPIINHNQCVHH